MKEQTAKRKKAQLYLAMHRKLLLPILYADGAIPLGNVIVFRQRVHDVHPKVRILLQESPKPLRLHADAQGLRGLLKRWDEVGNVDVIEFLDEGSYVILIPGLESVLMKRPACVLLQPRHQVLVCSRGQLPGERQQWLNVTVLVYMHHWLALELLVQSIVQSLVSSADCLGRAATLVCLLLHSAH